MTIKLFKEANKLHSYINNLQDLLNYLESDSYNYEAIGKTLRFLYGYEFRRDIKEIIEHYLDEYKSKFESL